MKILVTGGAGFIGSHLVDRLAEDPSNQISVYDNFSRGKLQNLDQHQNNPRLKIINADIRRYARLYKAAQGASLIYHLAAQSNVIGAISDPDYSFTTNVIGTYNVLKAAHEAGVPKVVFTSSREVYGEPRYLPVDEDHPIGSKNTYGASKVAGEMYCRVFQDHFNVEVAVLRLANVYGPRDYDRVITLWLEHAARGEDLTVFGGKQIIDFIWVNVVVEALQRAALNHLNSQPINVGSGQGVPILDLAQRILALAPTTSRLNILPARSAEVVAFTANVARMQTVLGILPPQDPLFGLQQLLKSR